MFELESIVFKFDVKGRMICQTPYGEGHINDTYYINISNKRYILQRINSRIFKRPSEVMSNIEKVTSFLKEKALRDGEDPSRITLSIIPSKDGKSYYKTTDNNYYRMYDFILGAKTYQAVEKPIHFYNAGKAFGRFQNLLADFPAGELFETIPNFHNTKARLENLLASAKADRANRVKNAAFEIEFAMQREKDASVIINLIDKGEIPIRVTHNDTKYNNIMIDDITGEGICIIDLDTVMPGSLLYDYGDSIRFGASSAAEDEKDLSKVFMQENLFELFTKGFFEEVGNIAVKAEIEYAPFAAKLMTYETGVRFLTDYLDGDIYFKTHFPEHNLDRARAQFKLVLDMEKKMDYMKGVISEYAKTRVGF